MIGRRCEVTSKNEKKHAINVSLFFVLAGVAFIVISFISEINFHYIQGFRPGAVQDDLFWKAEISEVFNSMVFLITGIIFLCFGIYFRSSRKKQKISKYG